MTGRWRRILCPRGKRCGPNFRHFSDRLFSGSQYSLSFGDDPRRLLAVSLKASRAFTVGELIENLKSAAASPGKHTPASAFEQDSRERLEAAQGAD